jgi:Domain of unknown function DUF29
MSNPTLYDDDILLWSEQQAAVIRDLGRTRRAPNDLDIENVAEEIETVGRNELAAVESNLRQLLLHLIKMFAEPDAVPRRHWAGEIVGFQSEMMRRYSPSMRQRIQLDELWRSARQQSLLAYAGTDRLPEGIPKQCPFDLNDFLRDQIDPDILVERICQAPE